MGRVAEAIDKIIYFHRNRATLIRLINFK